MTRYQWHLIDGDNAWPKIGAKIVVAMSTNSREGLVTLLEDLGAL